MATLFPTPAPTLPEFRSLLIEGPFHPSAPIHLMLSHVALEPFRRTLMLSPSRKDFASALINFDDEWLKIHGSEGRTCGASSRVDILYPPTRAHLALILSMLHVHDGSFYHPKTTLSVAPSLLVLYETSTLCADDSSGPTCVIV
ncbi:uncharacterized protein LAESUDRAFT_638905 [Laetiporus sulphureus 93-53]|uniref:Uncharacterized protein n=1 Tax=Laetiporus sulphureus 93-53 TaxID=1314785 RepID=A0A165IA42_9APHY|nr:uncharacterized protein LAESUDRAFT_638905 [Laetiporus sulphureus 93-53]KZT12791.1 hypothetical protein LAESUDRAFT_638905 [Laetiporus sulphureus 93-53]